MTMLVLAETSTAGGADPFWTGPVVAAFVASAVALLTGVSSWVIARGNRSAARREERVRFRLQQLNEFYEPLAMLRVTSRSLRKSLRQSEDDGSRWRLVRHIDEVKNNPAQARIAEAIIAINVQIEDVLVNKAGLMEGERPSSFERFMHHSRLLRIAWEGSGTGGTSPSGVTTVEDVPFPDEIDDDLDIGRQAVRRALERLQS